VFTADRPSLVNSGLLAVGKAHCSALLVVRFKNSGDIFIVICGLKVDS
jgi:hypothetical protein